MRNDADYHVRSPRGGKFSSLPSSFRTISNYLRSVSANASSIAASTVRQAAVSAASSGAFNHEDDRQREQVQWSNFDKLELSSGEIRRVLLLTYANGFQVWDVQDASNVHEVVSRRDGPAAFLRLQPRPILQEAVEGGASFKEARPLLLVVTSETGGSGSPGGYGGGGGGGGGGAGVGGSQLVATVVKFYSLRNHSYVHTLRFRTGIHAVRCSSRVIAVALATQIYCFDAGTLQNIFSVLTYPSAAPGPGSSQQGFGAMAVGPRWLAYPANQALVATTGRVAPQHLSPSPGVSPSSSPANGSFVAHYAKESSKHIVAGVVTLGDMVYKTTKSYCSELMPDGGSGSPAVGSPSWKNGGNGQSPWQGGTAPEPEFAGTVIIRDIVSKGVVAQFRAHTSPLSALAFDPSGTLLVTASVYGHNLNVYRVTPASSTSGGSGAGESGTSHVHLYKLARGVTNAVIQDVSFSADSHWIAVSSSRGTNHLFAVSPFGGMVGPQTHGTMPIDGLIGPTLTPAPVFPWWSSTGSLSVNQQAASSAPSAITLNVVSRIKNGNGGWRGTVTSAAVSATGRPNAGAGAVAAVFHDGGGAGVESEAGAGTLKDQLWVMCPTGHLLRYLLRPSAGGEGGYTNGLPQMAGMGSPGSPGVGQELKVAVEPVERWDVARRPNWVEREERVEARGAAEEEEAAGAQGSAGTWAGGLAREGTTTEEMQRWFMSNAEVQMHQARPVPIWAKSKVQFHVMLTGTAGAAAEWDDEVQGDGEGEMEIERVPTRIVEVRRKDLVPVIERLEKLKKVQGAREVMVADSLPGVSNGHDQVAGEEGVQDGSGRWAAGLRGVPIRRSSSCSSFGSEGGAVGGNGGGANGFHRGYQDSPATDTPPSSFGSPPYFHQTQQGLAAAAAGRSDGPLIRSMSGGSEVYQDRSMAAAEGGAVATGPPINIPRAEQRDVLTSFMKPGGRGGGGGGGEFPNSGGSGSGDAEGGSAGEGSSDGRVGRHGTGLGAAGSGDSVTRELEDLGVRENGGKRSGVSSSGNGQSRWDALPIGQASAKQGPGSARAAEVADRGFEGAFVLEGCGIHGGEGGVGDSPLDSSPGLGDGGGRGEDGESEDTEGGRSKSEENESAEQGDDVWEGSMFPFCEEDC